MWSWQKVREAIFEILGMNWRIMEMTEMILAMQESRCRVASTRFSASRGPFLLWFPSVSVFWEAKISFSKELSYKKTIVQIFNVG